MVQAHLAGHPQPQQLDRPSAPAQALRAGSPAWSLCPGSWMGGAGCSQETELEVLHIPLKTRGRNQLLAAESSQGRTKGREGDWEKEGLCGIQFWSERGTRDGRRPHTSVLGQAPELTVKLTQGWTVAMSDQI